MGIKDFHNWIRTKYYKSFVDFKQHKSFESIYVDTNYLLHFAIYKAASYEDFFNKLKNNIMIILRNFLPTKQMIFAFDGVPSKAKILTQQARRAGKQVPDDSQLNSFNFSPGTALMNRIEKDLLEYFKELELLYKFFSPKFMILSSTVCNEGELKLLHNLKHNTYNSHLLISNDADVVLMALAINRSNIYVLTHSNSKNELISIDLLPKSDNFIITSFFLGNDYFPSIKGCTFAKINTVNEIYENIHNKSLINNGIFNIEELENFMLIYLIKISAIKQSALTMNLNNVKNYLDSILWCFNMYKNAYCPNNDHIFTGEKVNAYGILLVIQSGRYKNILTISDTPSMTIQEYRKILHAQSNICPNCDAIHKELSTLYKKLYNIRNLNLPTNDIRAQLGISLKNLKEHKKTH